jgi:hypothetical protein
LILGKFTVGFTRFSVAAEASAFAEASSFAKAMEDETADEMMADGGHSGGMAAGFR